MEKLEEPRIKYISHKAKGVYANILLDDWFKIIFSYPPFPSTSFADLIGESHHHGA